MTSPSCRAAVHAAIASFLLLAVSIVHPAGVAAQRADSADVARGLMRDAAAALRRADTAAAIASVERAVQAWPRQGAYVLALGRLAARAARPDLAVPALRRAMAMGWGWTRRDPALASLVARADVQALADSAEAATGPSSTSTVLRTLPDTLQHPEGVVIDSATGRLFVSSIRHRKIVVIERDGRVHDFVPPGAHGLDATFGMAVDAARRTLWVASSLTPEQEGGTGLKANRAAIFAFGVERGELRGRWGVPDDGAEHGLGDVVIGPDGTAWASDSRTAALYRATPGDRSGIATRSPIMSPDWQSPQGMAFSADGTTLWLADWTTGLFHIELATGRVTPVAADPLLVTLGIDGLYRVGPRALIGIQNGVTPPRVIRLDLDAAGTRVERLTVLDRHLPLADEPTLGTVTADGFVYVANSPWGAYDERGALRTGVAIPAPVLLRLPLGR